MNQMCLTDYYFASSIRVVRQQNAAGKRSIMSFNKVILVGNLGRDPELRYTPQGTPVCSFSIATNERRKDKTGEWQDQTTWFRVTL